MKYVNRQIQWVVRERLADQLAAECGFEREILSVIGEVEDKYRRWLKDYSLPKYTLFHLWFTLGLDKGLSLKRAGFYELGKIYIQRLMQQIPSTKPGKKFYRLYLELHRNLSDEPVLDVIAVYRALTTARNNF